MKNTKHIANAQEDFKDMAKQKPIVAMIYDFDGALALGYPEIVPQHRKTRKENYYRIIKCATNDQQKTEDMKTIRLIYPQWQGADISQWIPEVHVAG